MTANINPKTGIAYGYVAANDLDPELVDTMLTNGVNLTYKQALADHLAKARRSHEDMTDGGAPEDYEFPGFDEEAETEKFNETYEMGEDIVEGVVTASIGDSDPAGVYYCSSWMGGALHFFIYESPVRTRFGKRASPCVPNACILPPDVEQGSVEGYDVPDDWYRPGALRHPAKDTVDDLLVELDAGLQELGYAGDDSVGGADTVDFICQLYERIRETARVINNNRREV